MDELSHLELRRIAERALGTMEHIENVLTEARPRYDGPALRGAIDGLDAIYRELAELIDAERREMINNRLALTRERFRPEALRRNDALSARGFTSLTRSLQHCEHAVHALRRFIDGMNQEQPFAEFTEHMREAVGEIGNSIHYGYLTTLADR